MKLQTAVEKVRSNPKVIFLMDGAGALVTSLSLFGIGFLLQEYFGMPKNILFILASVVIFYAVYSLSCSFFLFDETGKPKRKWQSFLKVIIAGNILYCVVMSFLLMTHYDTLTVLGIAYFTFEIIIILSLVLFEIKIISSN
ncbi:hypothetical protein [Bernardetia sp.]|uniref:hypothetical protein n=1 Tax=Bernardetia sp. TaxID=1937974 RepID=UPI0025BFE97A|nr:hypothetical protein [Bernardetia sp.]